MKKKSNNILKIIIYLLLIVSLIGLGVSIYNIAIWQLDNNKNNQETESINELVNITEINDTDSTEIINNNEIDENNPYYKFIKMNLIEVDLTDLKNTNNETIGWIEMPGTNINYPFVQTSDNDYYLTHSFYKAKNDSGWIYMDYRNNPYGSNKNTIIYGHGRLNGTMFGTLKNALKSSYYDNDNYGIIRLSTEYENTLWQVFSSYTIPTTNDYIQTDFASDEEYENFLSMLKERSVHDYHVTLTCEDQILTLSSCYNSTDKIVVHAKLIKRISKSN